ncbi:MAG: hypothetical protein HQ525_02700 [Anaerolineae bacterium]|nr:hypothetical protein [Anaerolineae bacterium]
MKPKTTFFFLLISLLPSACGSQPTLMPEITPTLTATIQPTATSIPSPAPTNALQPTPTLTNWCSPDGVLKNDFSVVGYFPDYREFNIEWGEVVTDFIYFSAEPFPNGSLNAYRLKPKVLQGMREMKAVYGTRLFISIGGYERSEHFSTMVRYEKPREKFAEELIQFALENNLDGIDFDWEFPQTSAEIAGYMELMKTIRDSGLIVSVALYPFEEFDLAPYADIDRIYIMSYERGLQHSTYEQSIRDVEFFLDAGVPPEKIFLGIPFYGREMAYPQRAFTYAEIVDAYAPSAETNEVENIYFNGIQSVRDKTRYAYENEFGGIMIWELAQDTQDETSLLRAIGEILLQSCQ